MAYLSPPGFQVGEALSKSGPLLMLAIIYPVLEEMVFRGALQGWMRKRSWGLRQFGPLTTANMLTSFVFTSFHFLAHPPIAAAMVFAPSLIFGYFRDRTHGLGTPIALHCWYNTGYFLIFGMA